MTSAMKTAEQVSMRKPVRCMGSLETDAGCLQVVAGVPGVCGGQTSFTRQAVN